MSASYMQTSAKNPMVLQLASTVKWRIAVSINQFIVFADSSNKILTCLNKLKTRIFVISASSSLRQQSQQTFDIKNHQASNLQSQQSCNLKTQQTCNLRSQQTRYLKSQQTCELKPNRPVIYIKG